MAKDNTEWYVPKGNSHVSTTAILKSDIVQLYKEGKGLAYIGDIYGVSRPVIRGIVTEAGVELRSPTGSAKKINIDKRVLQKLLDEGKTYTQISTTTGVGKQTVANRANEYGLKQRNRKAKKRKYLDTEWLREQYITMDKTFEQIAMQEGVSESNVTRAARRRGIFKQKDTRYLDDEWLYEQYVLKKMRLSDICTMCKVSYNTLIIVMRDKGFDIRGHTATEQSRIRASMAKQGITDIAEWGGFITNPKSRTDYEYYEWRRKVFEMCDYTCQNCFKRGGHDLQAHHIKRFAKHPELRYDVNNGIIFCEECHEEEHSMERREWAKLANNS